MLNLSFWNWIDVLWRGNFVFVFSELPEVKKPVIVTWGMMLLSYYIDHSNKFGACVRFIPEEKGMFGIRDIDIWFPAEASQYIGIWESAPCRVTFFHYFCTWNERTKTHTGIQCGGAAADPARGLCGKSLHTHPDEYYRYLTENDANTTSPALVDDCAICHFHFFSYIHSTDWVLDSEFRLLETFFRPECYDPAIVAISGSQLRAPPAIG